MCGIFGYTTTKPDARRESALSEARRALAHRGPDDEGEVLLTAGGVVCGLAHTRLSIIDLSPAGHQPMSTEDGRFTLTYNGEVYNHADVRRELEALGERFRSTSDTEVVLKAYARWGRDSLRRLRGMFAFGIFDAEQKSLVLARDRLGIKPLYYVTHDGGVTFASEVRALLAAGAAPRKLSPWAVESLLAYGSVSEPATILDRVRSLPPGCLLEHREGATSLARYWDIPPVTPEARGADAREVQEMTFAAAASRIQPILKDAVRMMLVADVPVGVFLSGGIDSSVIVALAAEASSRPVHTFTVTFDEGEYSEAPFAAEVARRFGCDHHQVHLPASRVVRDISAAVAALDQPSADGVNTYFVSKAAKDAGLRVALSGLGADELFAGYSHFRSFNRMLTAARAARAASPLVASARLALYAATDAAGAVPHRARKLLDALTTRGDPEAMYAVVRSMFTEGQRRALLDPGFVSEIMRAGVSVPETFDASSPGAPGPIDAVNVLSALEISNYLKNTLLRDTDVMSMAHALEVRPPFLDHLLVEEILRVPGRLKLRAGESKPLLLAAVPGRLPAAVSRPKMGFTLPFDAWFRGPLRGFMEGVLLGAPVRRLSFLRPRAVRALWSGFLRSPSLVSHARVWSIAALALWCEANGVDA